MFYVTCRFEFDSAHRLFRYSGRCSRLHGHRYVVDVTVRGSELNAQGMLIDFGDLKQEVCKIVDEWDHRTVLHPDDTLAVSLVAGDEVRVLPGGGNPTAENMAEHLFRRIQESLQATVQVASIRLYETPDCWVEYRDE